jgi:exonuclease SbcD
MRCVVSADWHVGPYRNGPEIQGVNGRFLDIMDRINEVIDYMVANQIKHLFFLGDMFKVRQPENAHAAAVSKIFKVLADHKIVCWFIPGNHDQARFRGQAHALAVYQPISPPGYINIADEPDEFQIGGERFLLFPYISSPQDPKLKAFLSRIKNPQECILLMHGSIEGCKLLDSDEIEINDKDTVRMDTIRKVGAVFAGHVHRPQQFEHVMYPGALERLTFNDEPDERGFLDVTMEKGKVSAQLIPVHARRMMTLHAGHIPAIRRGEVDVKGAIVRIKGAKSDEVVAIRQALHDGGCYYVSSVQSQEVAVKEAPKTGLTVIELVKRYAKKRSYPEDGIESAAALITGTLNMVTE